MIDWDELAYYARAAWPGAEVTMDPNDEDERVLNIRGSRFSIGWGADDPENITIYTEVWHGGYHEPPASDVVDVETLPVSIGCGEIIRAAWMHEQAEIINDRLADAAHARFEMQARAALDAAGGGN